MDEVVKLLDFRLTEVEGHLALVIGIADQALVIKEAIHVGMGDADERSQITGHGLHPKERFTLANEPGDVFLVSVQTGDVCGIYASSLRHKDPLWRWLGPEQEVGASLRPDLTSSTASGITSSITSGTMGESLKVRENRIRRKADRQGLRLLKSRRRDEDAIDFGGYMLVDAQTNAAVLGSGAFAYQASLEDVEAFLTQ